MIGKVTITREQADAIEHFLSRNQGDKARLLDLHAEKISKFRDVWIADSYKAMNSLSQADMARALLIGYEVEPKFQQDDWAKMVFADGRQAIGRVDTFAFDDIIFSYLDENLERERCRTHRDDAEIPTPEEIKAEQERRVWVKIGREVGEFKEGDCGVHITGNDVTRMDFVIRNWYERGELKGIYPAESFVSFEEGEEE